MGEINLRETYFFLTVTCWTFKERSGRKVTPPLVFGKFAMFRRHIATWIFEPMRIFLSLGTAVYEVIITDLPQNQLPSWFASTQMKVKTNNARCAITNRISSQKQKNTSESEWVKPVTIWLKWQAVCYLTTQHPPQFQTKVLLVEQNLFHLVSSNKKKTKCVCY